MKGILIMCKHLLILVVRPFYDQDVARAHLRGAWVSSSLACTLALQAVGALNAYGMHAVVANELNTRKDHVEIVAPAGKFCGA